MPQRIEKYRAAVAGETFAFRYHFPGQTFEVRPKGDGNNGQWVCLTCGLPLANQLEKDVHTGEKKPHVSRMTVTIGAPAKHVLAWRSFISGEIEVP